MTSGFANFAENAVVREDRLLMIDHLYLWVGLNLFAFGDVIEVAEIAKNDRAFFADVIAVQNFLRLERCARLDGEGAFDRDGVALDISGDDDVLHIDLQCVWNVDFCWACGWNQPTTYSEGRFRTHLTVNMHAHDGRALSFTVDNGGGIWGDGNLALE